MLRHLFLRFLGRIVAVRAARMQATSRRRCDMLQARPTRGSRRWRIRAFSAPAIEVARIAACILVFVIVYAMLSRDLGLIGLL
ncbi:MAG: hypothetical protein AAF674_10460 [Pseudomonadota bacterium]